MHEVVILNEHGNYIDLILSIFAILPASLYFKSGYSRARHCEASRRQVWVVVNIFIKLIIVK